MAGGPFLAEIAIPTADECLLFLGPLAAMAFVWWLFHFVDQVIRRIFPGLEWERQLGWLNIRSERRAEAVLRWLGYLVYGVLAAALGGIVWGAVGLRQLDNWSDPMVTADLALRVPVLVLSFVPWLIYLAGALWPRLRREYEQEELEQYRAEQAALENEGEAHPGSRLPAPPQLWTKSPYSPAPRRKR
jgi:hypothetical protein